VLTTGTVKVALGIWCGAVS